VGLGWCRDGIGSEPESIPTSRDATPVDERTNFFVGWGTLALINAGLAQGKGRSGLIWCLLSLVLGPIATFLIVVLDKVRVDGE
jgi:hypothetical protein